MAIVVWEMGLTDECAITLCEFYQITQSGDESIERDLRYRKLNYDRLVGRGHEESKAEKNYLMLFVTEWRWDFGCLTIDQIE